MNREVERLTGKDVRAALAKFFTQGRVTKLRQLIAETKRVDQYILAAVGQTSDYDMNSMLYLHDVACCVHRILHCCNIFENLKP